ncbi:unnamed protein product, partial [Urochloa humidicola]
ETRAQPDPVRSVVVFSTRLSAGSDHHHRPPPSPLSVAGDHPLLRRPRHAYPSKGYLPTSKPRLALPTSGPVTSPLPPPRSKNLARLPLEPAPL